MSEWSIYFHLRARYYAPALGRFTQQDTHWSTANMIYGDNPQKINEREDALGLKHYSYVPQITAVMQSGNLYVYGVNNPVAYVDPTGEAVANIIGAVIGAGGGALLGTMVADHYELTGWKRAVTIGGFTIGGAVLGWFAGGVVEKLAMKIATKMGLIKAAETAAPAAAATVSATSQNAIPTFVQSEGALVSWLTQSFYKTKALMSTALVKEVVALARQFGVAISAHTGHVPSAWTSFHMHIGDNRVHVNITEEAYKWLMEILK